MHFLGLVLVDSFMNTNHLDRMLKTNNFVPNWYTKYFNMLVISSREFRDNQKKYFEKADNGEKIIVQRGKDKSYSISPVSDDDLYFSVEMIKRLKRSLLEAESGEVESINTSEEIKLLLGL